MISEREQNSRAVYLLLFMELNLFFCLENENTIINTTAEYFFFLSVVLSNLSVVK